MNKNFLLVTLLLFLLFLTLLVFCAVFVPKENQPIQQRHDLPESTSFSFYFEAYAVYLNDFFETDGNNKVVRFGEILKTPLCIIKIDNFARLNNW